MKRLPVFFLTTLLAACGGDDPVSARTGPGAPDIPVSPPHVTPDEARAVASLRARRAVRAAAVSAARFRYGVIQSEDASDVVTTRMLSGSRLNITIQGAGPDPIHLDTDKDTDQAAPGTFVVGGRDGVESLLLRQSDTDFTLARVGAEWDPGYGEWLAGGYLLHAVGDIEAGVIDAVEVGVFVDGPNVRSAPADLPETGTATYGGLASGVYTAVHGRDSAPPFGRRNLGEFEGAATLVANFGNRSIGGG